MDRQPLLVNVDWDFFEAVCLFIQYMIVFEGFNDLICITKQSTSVQTWLPPYL